MAMMNISDSTEVRLSNYSCTFIQNIICTNPDLALPLCDLLGQASDRSGASWPAPSNLRDISLLIRFLRILADNLSDTTYLLVIFPSDCNAAIIIECDF